VASSSVSPRGGTALTAALHVLFFALGMVLAIYGALLSARGPRVLDHAFSLGVLIAIVGNVAAAILARMALGRWGGITPLIGWLMIAYLLSISRPNGSVLLPGGDLQGGSLAFQTVGAIAGAITATLRTPRRWQPGPRVEPPRLADAPTGP
jgi:hypothetical protein